jgi:seryl-tRNA synthetase
MLDIRLLREDAERVRRGLAARNGRFDVDAIVELDARRRKLMTEAETLKGERNAVSKRIGARKKAGEDTAAEQAAMRQIGERIAALDAEARSVEADRDGRLLSLPNIPHASVPAGADASSNAVVRAWGAPRAFDFEPRSHVELMTRLGIVDFERSARMAGSGFPLLMGAGARLQRALIQFMLDLHTGEHGYTEVEPPFLCNAAAMTGTGQLPRLADDVYRVDPDGLYLVPTAEVPLTNLFREEIIAAPLPIRLTACTPCFRREAGAAGRDTRGLIRVHQFDKVEMVRFVEPERSYDELESLVGDAEDVLRRLGLPYRAVLLCAGDLGHCAAKCYDLELWAPGQNAWLEVSSCSNFEDYQTRRAGIRYRRPDGRVAYPHTLNGSGVALPRLMVALMENGQQADGSVVLPEAIRPYVGGLERLVPPAAGGAASP